MELKPNGSQPSLPGTTEYFTGTVLRPGDVVSCRRGKSTGAAPNAAMTHLAIQEELNGKVVD